MNVSLKQHQRQQQLLPRRTTPAHATPDYIKQPHPPALAVDRSAYTGKMDLTRIRFDCHKYLFGSNLETRGAMNAAKPDPKGRFLAIFLCFCAKNGTIESLGSIIATLSGQKPTAT